MYTQLTSSHPAPPPFLWPLRSRGLSSNGEGRMYYPRARSGSETDQMVVGGWVKAPHEDGSLVGA